MPRADVGEGECYDSQDGVTSSKTVRKSDEREIDERESSEYKDVAIARDKSKCAGTDHTGTAFIAGDELEDFGELGGVKTTPFGDDGLTSAEADGISEGEHHKRASKENRFVLLGSQVVPNDPRQIHGIDDDPRP